MKPLMFLLNLAWASRFRLPLLITVGFMVLDIRMTLDMTVETRVIRHVPNESSGDEDATAADNSDGNRARQALNTVLIVDVHFGSLFN